MGSQDGQILKIKDWSSAILESSACRVAIYRLLANKLSILQESFFGEPLGVQSQLLVNESVVDHEQSLRVLGTHKLVHAKFA